MNVLGFPLPATDATFTTMHKGSEPKTSVIGFTHYPDDINDPNYVEFGNLFDQSLTRVMGTYSICGFWFAFNSVDGELTTFTPATCPQ